MFLLFGRGTFYLFAVWDGIGLLGFKGPNNKKDQTAKTHMGSTGLI